MAQSTLLARKGEDADFAALTATTVTVNGTTLSTALLLASGQVADLNGEADALVLDADADTTISSPTDDQIDIELNSVDHIVLKCVATADAATTRNIMEIAFTSPVDTTGTNEHNALNIDIEIGNASGGTNTVNAIKIDNITGDAQVTETGILLGTGFDVGIDMQGTKIDLDAAGTTSITAGTDNTIDIEIAGANDFQLTANTFTALSGSTIATNTIAETTAASGVTVDGALIKDGVLFPVPTNVTGDGAITVPPGNTTFVITKAGVAVLTIADPVSGDNGKTLTFISSTAQAHTLSNAAGSGFNAGGAGTDVGTWGGAIGDGMQITAWGTKWLVNYLRNVTLG
jgi:hypothetical protein